MQVRSFGDPDATARATSAFPCLQPSDVANAILWCLAAPERMVDDAAECLKSISDSV